MISHLDIQAIDVHGHYGLYEQPASSNDLRNRFMTGNATLVVQRANDAGIALTVVSPLLGLMPRGKADAVAGNDEAWDVVSQTDGLLQYVIVNPLQPKTYEQASRMLGQRKCVGIKVHPEEHRYPIVEHGREIFAFAHEHDAVMLVHSGEQLSMPVDYVRFADEFPRAKLILAHIGCGWDGDLGHQVRAVQASRRGNVYADTSSAQSITPQLIEWAVKEIGAERVLFGTDTPLYSTAMQRIRIDSADLSDDAKRKILRDNAVALFGDRIAPHVSAGVSSRI